MLRFIVHFGACLPLVWLSYLVLSGEIGADPAERLVRELGFFGACSLWGSLSLTPLRLLTGVPQWVAYRRALGLWAFAYISLHLAAFISVWAGFDWGIVMEEVTQRPYIYVGLLAWPQGWPYYNGVVVFDSIYRMPGLGALREHIWSSPSTATR